ncbi:MAG: hypothetical protein EOM54_10655 [Clostridia bacterium]|nr:hypothetical protein [Clostridia bacterium]
MQVKYRIRELSALAILRNAREMDDGSYSFRLSEDATKKCIAYHAPQTQDDCALFFQAMCVLHGNDFMLPLGAEVIPDLEDILFYVDFSGIFDRKAVQKKYLDRQKQAEAMFRPEGITLDFGRGSYRYLAFERSGSMSRNSRLSFIREDFYEPVHKRMMLDMTIDRCQLSKLYAYNGLMLTSGFRFEDLSVWDAKRIVVVDNPITSVYEANIITVNDDGSDRAERKYSRVEGMADIDVLEFDGEGLISAELAEKLDIAYCAKHIHHSFQIRMPYIKGVVHEVDFHAMFTELDVPYILDIWGEKHSIDEADLILTKSMFKGFGWMTENGLTFAEYLKRCNAYRHALYLSGVSKAEKQEYTELNYQFLNTASIREEEFRPADLPLGWTHSPEEDGRQWITKATEIAYYNLTADRARQIQHFNEEAEKDGASEQDIALAKILKKNTLFIGEAVYTKELDGKAQALLKQYSLGRLLVSGDNRYLSGDLMRFMKMIIPDGYEGVRARLEYECYLDTTANAPGAAYAENDRYTLLRNPHIARNEEAAVLPPESIGYLRQKYLSHLHYVVMVDSRTLIPERLGGADFDGDMIKTISDPLLNACIARNYRDNDYDAYGYRNGIPLLKIPSAEPMIRDANDWLARFETIRSTFSTRIGQMCNAAFDRSIIAYDENSDDELRERLREETEMLEILTGLEIDSVKSGVKPDLSEYLSHKPVSRSLFLKYKTIVGDSESKDWYEPTKKERLDKFFASVDWNAVSSNVEKLPYLARMLEQNTPKYKAKSAKDSELFAFAKKDGWQDMLPAESLEYMRGLIEDYEEALKRVRISRIERKSMIRRSDVERILYARGQENAFTADELYGILSDLPAEEVARFRRDLTVQQWHLMDERQRAYFLLGVLPYNADPKYTELFADFRFGGCRVLGDILCDLDDMYRAEESRRFALHRRQDSAPLQYMMDGYERGGGDYKELITKRCRQYINLKLKPDTALMCAIALGKRSFAFDVLLDRIEPNAAKGRRGK